MNIKKYVFKPYSELFATLYRQEKERILQKIKPVDIQHVGSTAVPGLGGKGIIDIALAVTKEEIETVSKKLTELGYIFRESGSTPERVFFRVDLPDTQEGIRRYHLHVTFPQSTEWNSLLAFRDYLRTNSKAKHEYAALKKKSALVANQDGEQYRKLKEPFFSKAMHYKILFVIGASGAGKTTTLEHLQTTMPKNCQLRHFDDVGVPSFESMEKEFGSIEEWQRIKTREWVKKLVKEELRSSHVIFDAQIRPSFIAEACNTFGVQYEVLLLDCSDDERKRRLVQRGHPELADANMMNWAGYLRNECAKHCHKIINNTHITLEQTFELFSSWLKNQLQSQIEIPTETVRHLIDTQFPQYTKLPIQEVKPNGWDNRTFRLGDTMSVRLPSAERYAGNVSIEHIYLPRLAPHLSHPIPTPIDKGTPSDAYPWNWSIYGWIEGKPLQTCKLSDSEKEHLAQELAHFLLELYSIDSSDGPKPSHHNFFRGGPLSTYDAETRSSLDNVASSIDVNLATTLWETATATEWQKQPVWIHGDFSPGNILVQDKKLAGVIDFGGIAIGDPACDLCIAWTFFTNKSREIFQETLSLDEDTWVRARGWALWKTLLAVESFGDKKHLRIIEALL